MICYVLITRFFTMCFSDVLYTFCDVFLKVTMSGQFYLSLNLQIKKF